MRSAVVVLVLIVGCLCAWVPAGSIYSFDQASYSVPAGSTVSIPVYLELSGAELGTAQTDGGMFQIGVRLTEDVGLTTASQPAFVASVADIQPNNLEFEPLFAFPSYTSSSDVALSVQSDGPTGPVTTSGQPTGRMLIGNFTFTAGNVAGETTVFDALDPDAMTNDTLTWNFSVLDPQMVASVQITTTAPLSPVGVPIPSAAWAGMVLLGGLALVRGTRFQRR